MGYQDWTRFCLRKAAIDWLDWQTKGDTQAAKSFTGAECGLCRDPAWAVKRKNIR